MSEKSGKIPQNLMAKEKEKKKKRSKGRKERKMKNQMIKKNFTIMIRETKL